MSTPESKQTTISALLNAIALVTQTQEQEAERPRFDAVSRQMESAAELMDWTVSANREAQERLDKILQSVNIDPARAQTLLEQIELDAAAVSRLREAFAKIEAHNASLQEIDHMTRNVSERLSAIATESAPALLPAAPARVSPMLKAAFEEAGSPNAEHKLRLILDACLGSAALNSASESPAARQARAQAEAILAQISPAPTATAPTQAAGASNPAEPAPAAAAQEPRVPRGEADFMGALKNASALLKSGSDLIEGNETLRAAKSVIMAAAAERLRAANRGAKPQDAAKAPPAAEPAAQAAAPKAPGAEASSSARTGGFESMMFDALARGLGDTLANQGIDKAAGRAHQWVDEQTEALRAQATSRARDLGGLLAGALGEFRARKPEDDKANGPKPPAPGA